MSKYKECGIVLRENNDMISNIAIRIIDNDIKLVFNPHGIITTTAIEKGVHLYITTDDKLMDGDWYSGQDGKIHQATSSGIASLVNAVKLKKIIATTDSSLGLPLIPHRFIRTFLDGFNKDERIYKVLVEYNTYDNQCDTLSCAVCNCSSDTQELVTELKLKGKYIIIKPSYD